MRRVLPSFVVVVALIGAWPLLAQTKAKAENVPVSRYTSVPNFFKLPPDLYFGEGIGIATNSKGHVFVYHRSGDTRLFEFDQNGTYVKEWGSGLYGLEFAHAVRVDGEDNIWVVDEGTNMVIKFNPEGRVMMVLGRRPEPVAGAFDSTLPAGAAREVPVRTADRRDVGSAGQHLRFRRLRQLARREVRQERPVPQVGRRRARFGAEPDEHAALDHLRRAGQHLRRRIAATRACRCSTTTSSLRAIYDNVGNPWAVCISPGPHQYLFVSNSNPDSNPAASWAITGEIYKMELDGTIIGKFGKAGKGLGEFSTVHEIDCRNPNELYVSEISAWRAQKIILTPAAADHRGARDRGDRS